MPIIQKTTSETIKYRDLIQAALVAAALVNSSSGIRDDQMMFLATRECKYGLSIFDEHLLLRDDWYFGFKINNIARSSLKKAQDIFGECGLVSLQAAAAELESLIVHEAAAWFDETTSSN